MPEDMTFHMEGSAAGHAGDGDVDGQGGSHVGAALAHHPPAQPVPGEGDDPFRSDSSWVPDTGLTLPPLPCLSKGPLLQ